MGIQISYSGPVAIGLQVTAAVGLPWEHAQEWDYGTINSDQIKSRERQNQLQ